MGTALADLENRAVGQHTHAITDPGHRHGIDSGDPNTAGSPDPIPALDDRNKDYTDYATTGISINNAGSVAGTNAPYLQLLVCVKD